MNITEVLVGTKNYLLENGWAKGSFHEEDGSVCILGAMNRSALYVNNCDLRDKLRNETVHLLHDILGDDRTIMTWNDAEDRTFNDVMDLLDEAIIASKEVR